MSTKISKLFGQEWSTDTYLAYNCTDVNGYLVPEFVINFCEMDGVICRAEKLSEYQNRPIRVLGQPEPDSGNYIFCFSTWDATDEIVSKVLSVVRSDSIRHSN